MYLAHTKGIVEYAPPDLVSPNKTTRFAYQEPQLQTETFGLMHPL